MERRIQPGELEAIEAWISERPAFGRLAALWREEQEWILLEDEELDAEDVVQLDYWQLRVALHCMQHEKVPPIDCEQYSDLLYVLMEREYDPPDDLRSSGNAPSTRRVGRANICQ